MRLICISCIASRIEYENAPTYRGSQYVRDLTAPMTARLYTTCPVCTLMGYIDALISAAMIAITKTAYRIRTITNTEVAVASELLLTASPTASSIGSYNDSATRTVIKTVSTEPTLILPLLLDMSLPLIPILSPSSTDI